MSGQNLTAQTELTAPIGTDLLYIVDDPGGTPLPRKITGNNFLGNTELVGPRTDDTYNIGANAMAYRRIFFNNAEGLFTARDGCKGIHVYQDGAPQGTGVDMFIGMDNVFVGYYSQRAVLDDSALKTNAEDFSNLYQGKQDDPFIFLNTNVGDGSIATLGISVLKVAGLSARNGTAIFGFYDSTSDDGGGGIFLHARLDNAGTLFEHIDDVFTIRSGTTTMGGTDITEIRIGGTTVDAITPVDKLGGVRHNAIDLGVVTTNEWKDLFLAGQAQIGGDLNHDGTNVGFYTVAPVARPAAYTLTATQVPSRTLAANASATATNNNAVLSQVIQDLQANGLLQ